MFIFKSVAKNSAGYFIVITTIKYQFVIVNILTIILLPRR